MFYNKWSYWQYSNHHSKVLELWLFIICGMAWLPNNPVYPWSSQSDTIPRLFTIDSAYNGKYLIFHLVNFSLVMDNLSLNMIVHIMKLLTLSAILRYGTFVWMSQHKRSLSTLANIYESLEVTAYPKSLWKTTFLKSRYLIFT